MEPTLVIYSHSSFLDIVEITTDLLKKYKNKVLLIDENFNQEENYKDNYVKILKYKNNDPYATRLHQIEKLDDEMIIFTHEVDLLIKYDANILNQFQDFMKENNIDRIEFQHCAPPCHIDKRKFCSKEEIDFKDICKLYRTDNPEMIKYGYALYNVNPAMWKKDSLLKLVKKYPHLRYKNIEPNLGITKDLAEMKSYSLLVKNPINCGHFVSDSFYLPLHILRHGKIFDPRPMKKSYNVEMDKEILQIYNEIIKKYFKNSKRGYIRGFPG